MSVKPYHQMKKLARTLICLCSIIFAVSKAYAQDTTVTVTANTAPPDLPAYDQPECPVDGYLWVPGYWAYIRPNGYYWVPGVWVAAPEPGYLWTPAYWGYADGVYGFHAGYWGLNVGFYGGIYYGYGYGGYGYGGGRWEGGSFRYNTAVVNVNTTVVHNTYVDNTVIRNTTVNNHTSFNGPGGVTAQPRAEELAAMREHHIQPTSEQVNHQQLASRDKNQFASINRGHPRSVAMNKVGGTATRDQPHANASSNLGSTNANKSVVTNTNSQANANRKPAGNANTQANVSKPANNAATQKHGQQQPPQQARPQQAHPQQQARAQQQAHPQQQVKTQQQARPQPNYAPKLPQKH
jgi:WXXGXW repeat (2 copies)